MHVPFLKEFVLNPIEKGRTSVFLRRRSFRTVMLNRDSETPVNL